MYRKMTAMVLSSSSSLRPGMSSSSSSRSASVITSTLWRQQQQSRQRFSHSSGGVSTRMFSTLPTWKAPLIESNGDYREEAHLEELVGGPLYQSQSSLPRLPVPAVADTLAKLLPTVLPLAKSDDERHSFVEACSIFPEQTTALQERLLQRAAEFSNSSWLQLWWNQAGYLQVRDPVVIYVSYFFSFLDDPTAVTNVQRGAAMLWATAQFRHEVVSGSMTTNVLPGRKGQPPTPLCATAFKYMFHTCRIPQPEQDSVKIYDPSQYHHAVVARKGHFYAIDLVDAETGNPLPLDVLEQELAACIQDADHRPPAVELGICTSSNRDDWATARAELLRVGGVTMEQALATLESGAILLCLDDQSPVSRSEAANLFWHGTHVAGANRWFDKSVQLIVTDNGKAGLTGEHSMMDGMPMISYANHVTHIKYAMAKEQSQAMYSGLNQQQPSRGSSRNIFANALQQQLDTNGKNVVGMQVSKARNAFETLIDAHDLHVQCFQGYGSNFIKQAGFSPDAFVQMAMQLATYRLWKEQAGTYEATQVRIFLHGRTETTRTVSTASAAFIQRMGLRPLLDEHDVVTRTEKLALLEQAVASHATYMAHASKGQGVDRHLLGLSMVVKDGEAMPTLYSHPLYQRAKRWRVSTSHLTHPAIDNWGYGEVVPDGVGLSYSIHPNRCVFNVSGLKEHEWTDKLCYLLEEALLEMQRLVEMNKPPVSKL